MQLSLFTEPARPTSRDRRAEVIEALGGCWMLQLHTGRQIVAPGSRLYLPAGRQIGVFKIENVAIHWNAADLHCFQLRGDEGEFGFLHSEFLADPDQFIRGRSLSVWRPDQLWAFEPPAEARKQARAPKQAELISGQQLKRLIWDWMIAQYNAASDRQDLKATIEDRDRLRLNNAFWFCHKQIGEVAQRLGAAGFEVDEFEFHFWRSLELAAAIEGESLPATPPAPSQRRPVDLFPEPDAPPVTPANRTG